MSTATFYPATGADDGHWYGATFSNNAAVVTLGDGGGPYHSFVRFPNITIPNGSTITAAYVKLYASGNTATTDCNCVISFNDEDTAVAPTSAAEGAALNLTTATVAWNGMAAWTAGTGYDTPSLVDPLAEVIGRGMWASGNAVMVCIQDNTSTNSAYRDAYSYDGNSTYKAELHVEYTAAIAYDVPAASDTDTTAVPSITVFTSPAASESDTFVAPSNMSIVAAMAAGTDTDTLVAPLPKVTIHLPFETDSDSFIPPHINAPINQYIKFPNLSGKHLSLKFTNDTVDVGSYLLYMRMKIVKSSNRTGAECKFPNLSGSHIAIKFVGGVSSILDYSSIGILAKKE